jgi:flagellar biosynthesis/type III secretory pathway chaperone
MRSYGPTSVDPALSPLGAVLDEQIRCAEKMLAVLDREARALDAGDAEALNDAGAEKVRLVDTLDALEGERRDLTAVVSASARGELDARWQRLLELIERMKAENARNGARVDARRRQLVAALRILRGSDVPLYDAAGARRPSREGRPLGSA